MFGLGVLLGPSAGLATFAKPLHWVWHTLPNPCTRCGSTRPMRLVWNTLLCVRFGSARSMWCMGLERARLNVIWVWCQPNPTITWTWTLPDLSTFRFGFDQTQQHLGLSSVTPSTPSWRHVCQPNAPKMQETYTRIFFLIQLFLEKIYKDISIQSRLITM